MTTIAFPRDDAMLQGTDTGAGLPLVFQHGLGGSEAQVRDTLGELPGVRRLTLDCRAQGGSTAGSRRPFSFALFAEDLLDFCDASGIGKAVFGGISMGAALALRLAVRHPERVRALILARPAWLAEAAPATLQPYAAVAEALRADPPEAAKARFAASPWAVRLTQEAPDNLASLLGFFDSPDPSVTADLLADIAGDGPGITLADIAKLDLPVLVLGTAADVVHPLALARELATLIPGAAFAEIPAKGLDRAAHAAAFRAAVIEFLNGLRNPKEPMP